MTHDKIDYEFKHSQLSYDAKPNYQPYIKMLFFFSKMDGVSDEHFHRHWETVHADLTVACKAFGLYKIQRYTQIHQTSNYKEKVLASGADLLDFDGCSELWVKSWDDWERFSKSPDYANALAPDCRHFMGATIKVFVGEENLIYGKTGDPNGNDGIVS